MINITSKQLLVLVIFTLIMSPKTFVSADQLSPKEFKMISKMLEKTITSQYASDAQDQWSDYVTQVVKGNLTLYHRGDVTQPVFFSIMKNQTGKKVVVIERGADYIFPDDRNTFVVLRQKAGGKDYNVHTAVFFDMGKDKKILVWSDNRIEQIAKSEGALNIVRSRLLERTSVTDKRPRCEWIGTVLFCNAKKTVKAPARKFPPAPKQIKPPQPSRNSTGVDDNEASTEEVEAATEAETDALAEDGGESPTEGPSDAEETPSGDSDSTKDETSPTGEGDANLEGGESTVESENSTPEGSDGETAALTDSEGGSTDDTENETEIPEGEGEVNPSDSENSNKKAKARYILVKKGSKGRSIHKKFKQHRRGGRRESVPFKRHKKSEHSKST